MQVDVMVDQHAQRSGHQDDRVLVKHGDGRSFEGVLCLKHERDREKTDESKKGGAGGSQI